MPLIDLPPPLMPSPSLESGAAQRTPLSAGTPPSGRERVAAWSFMALSTLLFISLAPFARQPLPVVPAFIAVYQTAISMNDGLTALLLLGIGIHRGTPALVILASGYLFTALLAGAHLLSFPTLLQPYGLPGAGPQTTAWLYIFWHGGLPLWVLAYFRASDAVSTPGGIAAWRPLLTVLACVAACVLLATGGARFLPDIMDGQRHRETVRGLMILVCSLTLAAMVPAWTHRERDRLDLWLLTSLWAWLLDIALSALLNGGRFDLGFYAGRIYGLLSSFALLAALLFGALRTHVALIRSNREVELQRQEIADLYHHAPCGYHSLDPSGLVVAMNDTELRMLGYARDEVVGRLHIETLLSPASRQVFRRNFPQFTAVGVLNNLEVELVRKDGSLLPVLISANLVRGPHGEPRWSRSVVVDNRARKEADARLQSAREALEARVVERTRQLRQIASEATLAEETERRAIARDLHDDIGQLLHVAKIRLEALRRSGDADERARHCTQLDQALGEAGARIRSLTAQLSPPVLDQLGLVAALHWLAEEMERTYDLTVEVSDDGQPKPLPAPQALVMFRAVRELLINVSKHAQTQFALVDCSLEAGRLTLRVSDEGAGIGDINQALEGNRGFGLKSIRERLTYFSGAMHITAGPEHGTIIKLELPCEAAPAALETHR
ncbi:MASE4 domain-containing protein [Zoogloea sp.]|uniref:MASE4 domain-containing protein n=1 Tax=Zoogloea sp. TaxID=49181 RepID=UPI0031FC67A1